MYLGALPLDAWNIINARLAATFCIGIFGEMVAEPQEEGENTATEVEMRGYLVTRYVGREFELDPKLYKFCSDYMNKAPDRKVIAMEDEIRQWKAKRTERAAVG